MIAPRTMTLARLGQAEETLQGPRDQTDMLMTCKLSLFCVYTGDQAFCSSAETVVGNQRKRCSLLLKLPLGSLKDVMLVSALPFLALSYTVMCNHPWTPKP
jgi:hypothetical protein